MGLYDDAKESRLPPGDPRIAPSELSQCDRFEMARRIGFAKAEIREAMRFIEGSTWPWAIRAWAIRAYRALHRALQILEAGKAE